MRTSQLMAAALVAAAGSASFCALVVGCSGDDTAVPGTDGGDATADTSGDSLLPNEASDVLDSGGDVSDGGTEAEAAPIIPPPGDWSYQASAAQCQGLFSCCPGGADGGYDLAKCTQDGLLTVWEHVVPSRLDLYDAGHMSFDPDAGAACLAALRSFPCGLQTAAQWAAISNACFSTISGTIPAGQPGCRSSWECATSTYCDLSVDGGLCTQLAGQGQPCGTKAPGDEMCSYLGSDKPPLFCDHLSQPDAAPTCAGLLQNGATCVNQSFSHWYDQACASQLCGDNGKCGSNASVPYPGQCDAYRITDAGGG